jgi:hypothetical protein
MPSVKFKMKKKPKKDTRKANPKSRTFKKLKKMTGRKG